MTTLLFARHGQASFGQKNYDQLSKLGVKQAQLLGQLYGTSGRQISGVISGSLVRQRDSAQHFLQRYQALLPDAASLPTPLIIEGLNEFNHEDVLIQSNPKFATQMGILTEIAKAPMPKARLTELFYEALQRWYSGDYDDDYQESWPQFNERVQQALAQIIDLTEQPSRELSTHHSTYLVFTSWPRPPFRPGRAVSGSPEGRWSRGSRGPDQPGTVGASGGEASWPQYARLLPLAKLQFVQVAV